MTARSRTALITMAVAMLVIAERSPAADAGAPAAPAPAATTAPSKPSTWHDYLAGQHAYYRADLGVTKTDLFARNCDRPIDFVWTYDQGRFSLKVDGQELISKKTIDGVEFENAYVGLQVVHGGVKFTKLKVRKLVDKPANAAGQKQ